MEKSIINCSVSFMLGYRHKYKNAQEHDISCPYTLLLIKLLKTGMGFSLFVLCHRSYAHSIQAGSAMK